MSLSSLVRRGVGLQLEVLADPDADRLAETLVAFANSDGGSVLFGADASGQIIGGLQIEDIEGVLRSALAQCRPLVRTEWQQYEDRDGLAVAIKVPRSPDLHALADGRVLVRTSSGNQALDGAKISILASSKSTSDYESEIVPGASRTDLDDGIIEDYLQRRAARLGRDVGRSPIEILHSIGALSTEDQPTVAGLLLFGGHPEYFLPQSGLVYVRFAGTEPRGPGGLAGYQRREEFSGGLARIIEEVWAILLQEMRGEGVVRGLQREDRMLFPPFAVREALVNALCHRDYRLAGRRVEIRQFSDRLEISSPGGLPGYITLDNIVDEHFSRNPRLVNGLFEWGYIEQLGLGIDRMIEEMIQAGHRQPEFHATPYSFTVTLIRSCEALRPRPEWRSGMSERQMRALQHLQQYGRITNREYRELCPDVSPETLRLDLVDLVDKAVLLKIGDKKGTYYILK